MEEDEAGGGGGGEVECVLERGARGRGQVRGGTEGLL